MPFDVRVEDGVMTLTLDTPGSPVNIFNHATAAQLGAILADVTPATTRAIVFETAKPASFLNGVGLLLAQAARTHDDLVRASTPPWAAYRAVHEAPVPTVAVVRGNCFGCGVEFALQCDYRIAIDTAPTQFYMTELNDYLFIPLFGSTWTLPEAVGLSDAVDLLLWGRRWDAPTAYARGLADAVVADEAVTGAIVARVLAGAQPSRRRGRVAWGADEDRVVAETRRRIAALPPPYHAVYGDALALLEAGARQTTSYLQHQQQELLRSSASALAPIGKAAYGFFYLRQMASERAAGRPRDDGTPLRLAIRDRGPLGADLARRRVPGVTVVDDAAAELCLGAELAIVYAPGERRGALYAPTYAAGGRLVELATRPHDDALAPETAARLARALQRFGLEVARTTPAAGFVTDRLLLAFLTPLARWVASGGDVAIVNATLRAAGFVRRPHDLLADLDREGLGRLLDADAVRALECPDCPDVEGDELLLDALAISCVGAVVALRGAGAVRDTTIVDLIARELLDFPRHLVSLCSWLTTARVARALGRDPRVTALVATDTAAAFVAAGREFYR